MRRSNAVATVTSLALISLFFVTIVMKDVRHETEEKMEKVGTNMIIDTPSRYHISFIVL